MKVLSFGEVLWDIYPNEKYIGGAPFNFAAHFVKNGGEAKICTAIGNDFLCDETKEAIKKLNVSDDYLTVYDDKSTGTCIVEIDENGIPKYNVLTDVAYDLIDTDRVNEKFDAIYFGTLALRSDFNLKSIKKLLQKNLFREVIVDVNIREPFYSKETVIFALKNATILKISDEELPVILKFLNISELNDFKYISKQISEMYSNLKVIVITLGSNGSVAFDCKNSKLYVADALKTKVVSTVGAGDSFAAAFLFSYLNQCDIPTCLNTAAKVASFVVSKAEAVPDYNI